MESNNPMDVDVDGTPFSELMNRAVKLKNAQAAPLRSRFDGYPSFLQNSIYPRDEVIAARDIESFDEKIAAASAMKERGNIAFQQNLYADAMMQYEMAVAVFRYLENTNPSWKTEGLKDDFIRELSYHCKNEAEECQVACFLTACYNNMALTCIKLGNFHVAVQACNEAIALDCKNSKALYLRAQARLIPMSSGATEQCLALKDYQFASELDPTNRTISKELRRLRRSIEIQRQRDKSSFEGLFERGEIYLRDEQIGEEQRQRACEPAGEQRNLNRVFTIGEAMELAKMCDRKGLIDEKKALEQSICKANSARKEFNFRSPTPDMTKEAERMGIDLYDPRVLDMLEQLQKNRQNQKAAETEGTSPKSLRVESQPSLLPPWQKLFSVVSFILGIAFVSTWPLIFLWLLNFRSVDMGLGQSTI